MKRKMLGFIFAAVLCFTFAAFPVHTKAADAVIPQITIAAPWDDSITITFTDVFETYGIFDYGMGTYIFLSDTGTFSFDRDVYALVSGVPSPWTVPPQLLEANRTYHRNTFEWLNDGKRFTVGESSSSGYESEYILIDIADSIYRGRGELHSLTDIAIRTTPDAAPMPTPAPLTATSIAFNGQSLDFNLPIINRSGRNFYPMRELLEAVGA